MLKVYYCTKCNRFFYLQQEVDISCRACNNEMYKMKVPFISFTNMDMEERYMYLDREYKYTEHYFKWEKEYETRKRREEKVKERLKNIEELKNMKNFDIFTEYMQSLYEANAPKDEEES